MNETGSDGMGRMPFKDWMVCLSQRFSRIGRAGCVFYRKSFVVHSIRVSTIGLPSARDLLSPRLAKKFATRSFPPQQNRSGSGALRWMRSRIANSTGPDGPLRSQLPGSRPWR